MDIEFRGAGGPSSSSSSDGTNFVQKPDTLRSNDTFEGLLGLCVGPIKGPVNGLQSIRVNDTPIEDASGNLNFQDFTAIVADGDPLKYPQTVTLRLGSAGVPSTINLQLRNTVGTGSGTFITRTMNNMNVEAIDLRFIVSQLFKQTADGIFEQTANIEIQMKPTGTTTWINPFVSNDTSTSSPLPPYSTGGYPISSGVGSGDVQLYYTQQSYYNQKSLVGVSLSSAITQTITPYLTITGKTTSPFVKEVRIKVPNTGVYANKTWDVRVRLVEVETVDADPNFDKRTISWESVAGVYNPTLGNVEDWRGVAWLQLYGKASDAFNNAPAVDGIYDTKIVQVPPSTVYDPVARTFTGAVWNGSWSKAFTQDPAWIINDALSDSLAGLSRLMPNTHLNKWDALELSKYCSEKVSNGDGGLHPRFSMNLVVTEAQRSDDFIRWMAGACGATTWDNGDGEWRCIIDKPRNPVALFTNENIEGEFSYSHTDIDTRFNDVTVTFLNEEFDYREDRVRIEDTAHIAKYGRKPTKVVGIGCTHRQQAIRWAILKMRTGINEFRAVTFTTNRQGKYIERFDWILVADESLNMTVDDLKRTSGRIIENKGGSIVLRDTVRLEAGVAYNLRVTVPNPNYNPDSTTSPTNPDWALPTIVLTRTITNTALQRGDVNELFINSALPANCAENANVALEAAGLPSIPKVYRVVDLAYADDGERVIVSAIEVDTGKYIASDTANYNYQMPGYGSGGSGSGGVVPPPVAPAGGVFTLSTFKNTFGGVTRVLDANWDKPANCPDFSKFNVRYQVNSGAWRSTSQTADTWELAAPGPGRYNIEIRTVTQSGKMSLPLKGTIAVSSVPNSVYVSAGTPLIVGNYDYTGATALDLPKDVFYKLSANGIELNDATWQYRIVDGGANGFSTTSGWKTMTATGGIGKFTLTSIQVDNSKIEIKGTSAGRSASETVFLDKVTGPTSSSSGTGSASQTSGFNTLSTPGTSFVPITSQLDVTVPTGKTAMQAVVNLSVGLPTTASNDGPWNLEFKLQRLVGGVWTDIGTVQNSSPDPYSDTVDTTSGGFTPGDIGGDGSGLGSLP
jgi:predicted phage tail protein